MDAHKKKLLLVSKGLGKSHISLLQRNFDTFLADVPEPTDDEEGGISILTKSIKERYKKK